MRPFTTALSLGTTLMLALVAALPWGAGDVGRLVLPMLPVLAIIYWSLVPTPMPATGIFVAGLFIDAATQAPTGFWTAIALMIALFARALSRNIGDASIIGRGLVALASILLVVTGSWCLSYLYTLSVPPVWPHVAAAGWAIAAFIPVAALLSALRAVGGDTRSVLGRGPR